MSIRRMAMLIFWGVLFAAHVNFTVDPDLWWHLRTGEYIFKHGVPHADVFSYTIQGQALIAHESLFQVLLWLLYKVGGLPMIMMGTAFLCVWILWITYKTCAGKPYLTMYTLLLILPTFRLISAPRPQLISALMVVTLIFLVEKVKDHAYKHYVFCAIPFLFLIWANFHAGYMFGILIISTYILGESLQLLCRQNSERALNRQEIQSLSLALIFGFLAVGINPNGYHLWAYPIQQVFGHAQQVHVSEWQSPNFHSLASWPFVIMLGAWIVAWTSTRITPTFTEIFLFLITAMAGFLSLRHTPFFVLVNAPVFCRYILLSFKHTGIYSFLNGSLPEPKLARWQLFFNVFLLAIVLLASGLWAANMIADNDIAVKKEFPVMAMDFIRKNGLDRKRVYNDYNWGGYLLCQNIPVFIDGRAEIYGDKFINSYFDTLDMSKNWRSALNKYKVDYILLLANRPLVTLLTETHDWREIYRDNISVIFARV